MITAWVPGKPQPQGSKKGFIINGKVVLVESSKGLKPWRNKIREVVEHSENYKKLSGAIHVSVSFYFKQAKTNKTTSHVQKPDVDKCLRAVLDSLTGSVYDDDAQVVSVSCWKSWGKENVEGVNISIWEVDSEWNAVNA